MAMKIYRRYVAREALGAILLVLAAFLALFSFFDMVAELKNIGPRYQFKDVALGVLLHLPERTYELTPVAVLIGTLYALSTLARHSEITVLRASGLSTKGLLSILLQVAGVFAVVTFLFGEFVAPPAERYAARLLLQAKGNVIGQGTSTGLWFKDERSFINVRAVLPDTRLRGIRVYEFDERAMLRSVSEAAEGEYVPPASWKLTGVVQTILKGDGAVVERKPDMLWRSAINPDILSVLMVSPDRMSLQHLSAYTKHLSDNRQKTNRYDIAMWKKVIYPLAAFVMVALALPFGYTHNRMGGVSLKIFSGVMIGILFHMLNGLFSNLGAINSWSPFVSAITPSAMFMLAAMGMIWWVERR
jgi:lipopolysaccharide export system permease protein